MGAQFCWRNWMPIFFMAYKQNLSEKRFGRLIANKIVGHTGGGVNKWLCLCDCGKEHIASAECLMRGITKSCGCLRLETVRKIRKHGQAGKKTREYYAWSSMKARCSNSKKDDFKHYGGRKIKVCKRWLTSFENFYKDMGDIPSENHSLDRINVNKGYNPSNCRWATSEIQGNNKRNSRYFVLKGIKKTISQWSRIFKVPPSNLSIMLKRKTIEETYEYYKNKNNSGIDFIIF